MSDRSMPANDSILEPSLIEKALSLRPLTEQGADAFTNAAPLWNPPWGRGLFGGAAIAQCLVAAQATIPSSFSVHSMHCYFILAANSNEPIVYNVERVRDGRTFVIRMVQAQQQGTRIFTTTISFTRERRAQKMLEHSVPMPSDLRPPPDIVEDTTVLTKAGHTTDDRPCDCIRCPVGASDRPDTRKLRHWIRARGPISGHLLEMGIDEESLQIDGHTHHAHAAALAYMTDTYFIGTVYRAYNASRFSNKKIVDRALAMYQGSDSEIAERRRFFEQAAREELDENKDALDNDLQLDMTASLDHTIHFHNSRSLRADEWMLVEMETPWAGNERGLAVQRIWSKDGILVATCIQEGVVRLFQGVGRSHI